MWEDILGHTQQKEFLRNYLQAEERPHALLFCGPEGIGKRRLALALAKALLCRSHTAADGCDSCRLLKLEEESCNHPDFLLVQQELDPAKKTLRQITIDQIRELGSRLGTGAIMGSTRVCLIDACEQMNVFAANSLLKLLEEPPAGCVLLLISSAPETLLPTILSRVVQLRFQPLPQALAEQWLSHQELPREQVPVLARLSEGSPGLALRLYQEKLFPLREQVLEFLRALPLTTPLNFLSKRPWQQKDFLRLEALLLLQLCQLLLHDLLLCKLQLYDRIYNVDLCEELRSLSGYWTVAALRAALNATETAFTALKANVSVKMTLEALGLKIDQAYKEK